MRGLVAAAASGVEEDGGDPRKKATALGVMQGVPARAGGRGGRSEGRRTDLSRGRGEVAMVAAARTGPWRRARSGSSERGGERWIWGRGGAEASERGQVGEEIRGEPEASPLSPPSVSDDEVVGGDPSLVATRSEVEGRWVLGRWAGLAAQLGHLAQEGGFFSFSL